MALSGTLNAQGVMDAETVPQASTPTEETDRSRVWWLLAIVGLAAISVARILLFFNSYSKLAGDQTLPSTLYLVGDIGLVAGLALSSLLHRHLSWGARAALLLGACYFLFSGGSLR